jgi:hypothetical protein
MPDKSIATIHFTDVSFKTDDLKGVMLCVGLDTRRLSFALFDTESNRILQFESSDTNISHKPGSSAYNELYAGKLSEMMNSQKWDVSGFSSIRLYIAGEHYSLVPKSLFNRQNLESYLSLNQSIYPQAAFELAANDIPALDLVNIFAFPATIKAEIDKHLPGASIRHHISAVLGQLSTPGLFLHLGSGNLDIISIKKGLQFCQNFNYQSNEDILYHIAHIANHLNIDIKQSPVTILGGGDSIPIDLPFLREYVAKLEFIGKPGDIEFNNGPENLPYHHFYTLFSLKNCE